MGGARQRRAAKKRKSATSKRRRDRDLNCDNSSSLQDERSDIPAVIRNLYAINASERASAAAALAQMLADGSIDRQLLLRAGLARKLVRRLPDDDIASNVFVLSALQSLCDMGDFSQLVQCVDAGLVAAIEFFMKSVDENPGLLESTTPSGEPWRMIEKSILDILAAMSESDEDSVSGAVQHLRISDHLRHVLQCTDRTVVLAATRAMYTITVNVDHVAVEIANDPPRIMQCFDDPNQIDETTDQSTKDKYPAAACAFASGTVFNLIFEKLSGSGKAPTCNDCGEYFERFFKFASTYLSQNFSEKALDELREVPKSDELEFETDFSSLFTLVTILEILARVATSIHEIESSNPEALAFQSKLISSAVELWMPLLIDMRKSQVSKQKSFPPAVRGFSNKYQSALLECINNMLWSMNEIFVQKSKEGVFSDQLSEKQKASLLTLLRCEFQYLAEDKHALQEGYDSANFSLSACSAILNLMDGDVVTDLTDTAHILSQNFTSMKSVPTRVRTINLMARIAQSSGQQELNQFVGNLLIDVLEHSSQVQSDVWIEALEQLFELYGDENGEYEESVYQNAGFQSRLEQALAEMNNKIRESGSVALLSAPYGPNDPHAINAAQYLDDQNERVNEALSNLKAFIDYKQETRTKQ